MSWLAPAIAVGGSLLSGFLNNQAASDRQETGNDFSAQQFATRYQTTVADMKAAGLNPMLAYSQGGGSAPTSVMASAGGYPDLGQAMSSSFSAQAATRQADTSSRLVDATVDKTVQEVVNLKTDNDRSRALIDNLREQYQNLVKEGYNLTETGNVLRATVSKIRSEIPNLNEQNILLRIQQGLEQSRSELAAQDVRAGASFGELGKTVGALEPFLRLLWSAFRR